MLTVADVVRRPSRVAMHRANPATCEAAHAVAVLILNVPGRVHRPWLRFPRPGPQGPPNWSPTPRHVGPSSLHPSLAPPQVLVSNSSSLEIPSCRTNAWRLVFLARMRLFY